jgi:hypothetical protein
MFNYSNLTDNFMLIPIFAKVILSIVLPYFSDNEMAILFITMLIQLFLTAIPNVIRLESSCGSVSFQSLTKAFIDGTIAYGAGIVIPFILGFIPLVRIPISIINMIPIIGKATLWSLFYTLAYIFINMGNQDDKDRWCNPSGFGGRNIADTIFFWVFLILSIIVNIFNEYSPF